MFASALYVHILYIHVFTHINKYIYIYILKDFSPAYPIWDQRTQLFVSIKIGLCMLSGGRLWSACQQLYSALVLRVQFSQQIIQAFGCVLIPHLAVCVSDLCAADCVYVLRPYSWQRDYTGAQLRSAFVHTLLRLVRVCTCFSECVCAKGANDYMCLKCFSCFSQTLSKCIRK